MGLPTFAQNLAASLHLPHETQFLKSCGPDEIIKQAQERFKKAQNKEQVESVKMWCKDMIAELTFTRGRATAVGSKNSSRRT